MGREAFSAALSEAAELLRHGGCDLIMLEMMYHPERFRLALEILARHFTGPRFAYPDSGYFRMPHWQFEDIIAPADLASCAEGWIADGIGAVGGCCGLSVEHIEALAPLKR